MIAAALAIACDPPVHQHDPVAGDASVAHDASTSDEAGGEPASASSQLRTDRDSGTETPTIVLREPVFFDLPINSLRFAVSGHDAASGLCITAVFFPTEDAQLVRHCDDFDHTWFPYVVVEPANAAGCWDYGSTVTLESARGCVDWASFGPSHADEATLELAIDSPLWSGHIIFAKPR
jgi:hypothetical protein